MEAKKKPIDVISLGDLGISPTSTQKIVEVRSAPERASGEVIEDDGEAYQRIIEALEQAKVI